MGLDKEGSKSQPSFVGSIFSLMVFGTVLSYAILKVQNLMEKKDVDILSTVEEFHFEELDLFTTKQGLQIAVAFTGFNSNTEYELDPAYGELIFNRIEWSVTDETIV